MNAILSFVVRRPKLSLIGALIAVSGAYATYQEVKQTNLEKRIAVLEAEAARKDLEISSLQTAVSIQNIQVDRWGTLYEQGKANQEKIQAQYLVEKQTADELAGKISAYELDSCEDAGELIDEILGLD